MTRHRRSGDPNINKLIVNTNCGPDNEFNIPREARWSAALGKLLVVQGGTNDTRFGLRAADLSYFAKFAGSSPVAIDSDNSNIFIAKYGASSQIFKLSFYGYGVVTNGPFISNIRMISAQPANHILTTSNNAADGHGIYLVRKSDMTVVASILATGTGDNQFTNPLGVFYVAGNAYVCDSTRIIQLAVDDTLGTLTWVTSWAIVANDLCFDGTNWFVQSATQTIKYDASFTDATKVAVACVGYSLTIIPDQSDGYGATLAITNNSGSCLYRRKCSDLSLIATVGSAGDGSASLFDPTFTTSVPTQIEYKFDDGFSYVTASGTSHALSWNGFAGYSFRSAGPHRCTVTVRGGLRAVSDIDVRIDSITAIKNFRRMRLSTCNIHTNPSLALSLADVDQSALVDLRFDNNSTIRINTSDIIARLITLSGSACVYFGNISLLPTSLQTCHLFSSSGLTPDTIALFIAIRDLRIYSMEWTAQQNTDVLLSAWGARANYTYASGILLRISAPTGTPGTEPPAEEGPGHDTADWAWNAGTSRYDPLTGYAVISDLQTDFYSEGFKPWAVTIV